MMSDSSEINIYEEYALFKLIKEHTDVRFLKDGLCVSEEEISNCLKSELCSVNEDLYAEIVDLVFNTEGKVEYEADGPLCSFEAKTYVIGWKGYYRLELGGDVSIYRNLEDAMPLDSYEIDDEKLK
jgi:hypothetical protein